METPGMVGGKYPKGTRHCLTLKELEANVPSKVLLQCYSCLMLNKPSLRELVRKYGQIQWGQTTNTTNNNSNTTNNSSKHHPHHSEDANTNASTPKTTANISSTTTNKHVVSAEATSAAAASKNSNMQVTKTISGDTKLPAKQPKKRRNNTFSSANVSNTRENTRVTGELAAAAAAVDMDRARTITTFSTVQILRSLAVCLKTIPAKKAALQWAEQQLMTDSNGQDPHRLLGQWKQYFQKLELKATVVSRKKTRTKMSKQTKKERHLLKKKELKEYFIEGQEIERNILENHFDMTTRSVYEPPYRRGGGTESQDGGGSGSGSGGEDELASTMYPDDFEDDDEDHQASWSFVTS
jgi:23S rRNA U2552 (ribose-2'-O)-methylase RlmE/FtsJ